MLNEVRPFPKVLRIEPASQCNLACVHCPTGTRSLERGIMSQNMFNLVLDEVKRHKDLIKVIVLYHGGEPLLNKQFFEMVKSLKQVNSGFFIKTVSNGMALTQKNAQLLAESGIDSVEFSLDGISHEMNDMVRKNSNSIKIIENINYFINYIQSKSIDIKIYISTTQFLSLDALQDNRTEVETPLWLYEQFNGRVEGFKATPAMVWPDLGDSGFFDSVCLNEVEVNKNYCDHVINTLTVRSDGNIVPCCYDLTSALQMGNIQQESLLEIWNGEKYQTLRSSIESENYQPLCNNCNVVRPSRYLYFKSVKAENSD